MIRDFRLYISSQLEIASAAARNDSFFQSSNVPVNSALAQHIALLKIILHNQHYPRYSPVGL